MTPEELEKFIHRELRALPPRKAPAGFEVRMQAAIEARQALRALTPEQLEQLVHRELHSLPPRRAPRTLEARVLTAIEQRAAVAWYHKSWSHWPAAVRAAFLVLATAVTGAVMTAFYQMFTGVETSTFAVQAGAKLNIIAKLWHAAVWIVEFAANVIGSIPSVWLYGGVALVVALYATLFGLGAAAYRTLYRHN